jgi:CBS-domain-containing membrane protein
MDDRTPVSEIMTRSVVVAKAEMSLEQAARLMREYHISGLPVIGEDRRVLGIVSERDLVRDLHKATGIASARGLLDLLLGSAPEKGESLLEVCHHRLRNGHVRDAMTSKAIPVDHEATLHEAARLMQLSRVNRLPVLDEKKRLVGIVTRGDVVRAITGGPEHARGSLRPAPLPARVRRERPDPYSDI